MNKQRFIRIRVLESIEEVNHLLDVLDDLALNIIYLNDSIYSNVEEAIYFGLNLSCNAFIFEKDTKLEITTKFYTNDKNKVPKATTWVFQMNDEIPKIITGRKAYAEFNKAFHVPNLKDYDEELDKLLEYDHIEERYINSASPKIGFNDKYQYKWISNVYEYDINSAYSNVLYHFVIDWTKSPRYNDNVGHNEVGFLLDNKLTLIKNGYAAIILHIRKPNEIERRYIANWNTKKRSSSTIIDRQKAKDMLNLPIGYTQRKNPFFRAFVVHLCNDYITKKIDEDTIMWNTDAVYCLKKRDDLKIGKGIGQFNETILTRFCYIGNNYQADEELPMYRGVPKQWFRSFESLVGRRWDISKDMLPDRINKYEFDRINMKMTEVDINAKAKNYCEREKELELKKIIREGI